MSNIKGCKWKRLLIKVIIKEWLNSFRFKKKWEFIILINFLLNQHKIIIIVKMRIEKGAKNWLINYWKLAFLN